MQIEMSFDAPPADRQQPGDFARLHSTLSGRGWQTGASIRLKLGWTERRLRAAASASEGRVLSWPGSKGYCLTSEADQDDINHGINAMRRQADEMIARAKDIQRASWSRIRDHDLDHMEERE